MSNPSDYTVLWICALTTEYVAAQALLDEEDPKSEAGTISINDTNTYTLGRVAGHKVVIAVLPKGEYGVGSAASVITHILRSFPNIRIGLMVGIGGGAPTKANDVRLGDVVVSSPKDGHGGVYHYDLGKEVQDSGFRNTGFLDQPPTVVRTAVSALEAIHIPLENDRLYEADIVHPASEENCDDACGTESYKLVTRHPRDEDDDIPVVHYGLIGSGNKVIKDAVLRDKLAREQGVLCFEMEATGIMNRMPCLVVRGICDYCDSHKNKDWQGYAAMTAAAYTKELLLEIPCKDVEREERLAVAVKQLSSDVHAVAESLEQIKSSEQVSAIISWLKPTDPSVNYNRALQAHHPGTGEWFLGSTQFQKWKEQSSSFLWLHGSSGCGKTILSAAIIQHVCNEQDSPTIWFHFDFSDPKKQHFEDMLRSLLIQLYHKSPVARMIINALFDSHARGTQQPSIDQMRGTLETILEHSTNAAIIVDALDEAEFSSELVQWCRAIDSSETFKVRLLVISRTQIVDWPKNEHVVFLNPESVSKDIKYYTRRRLRSEEFNNWVNQQALRDKVETIIAEKAGGMFRWAALQLDSLRQCRNRLAIEKTLRDLAKTLNDTYARMLASIQATHYRREVTLVLQMLLWSDQRLTLEACNDAIIVQPENKPGFSAQNRFFDSHDILNICSGLVITVWSNTGFIDSQYLQLAHSSVREYLSSQDIIQPFHSQLEEGCAVTCLVRLCRAYLCCIDWSIMDDKPDEFDQMFPLAGWAASTWPEHTRYLETVDDDALAYVLDFLQQVCVLSEQFFRYSIAPFSWADKTQCYPLYLAAFFGLQRSCRQLLQSDLADTHEGLIRRYLRPTQTSTNLATMQIRLDASLLAASSRGYDTVVQDLLIRGARPDAFRSRRYSEEYTALRLASKFGHTKVVRLLIQGGSSINLNEKPSHKTALYEASESGQTDIVKVVLAHNADPDICSNSWSPLRVAVCYGHVAVAQALISVGANRDINSVYYIATNFRRGRVCRRGYFDIDVDDDNITTLLKIAVNQEDYGMVKLLLDNGFGMFDANGHDQRVLHVAAKRCNIPILRMLLDRGALIDAPGPKGTALAVAARSGRGGIVQTLLDYGANLSECRWHGPLLIAAEEGHFDVVNKILLHGVHINDSGPLGTALYQAAWKGLEMLVRILIQHRAMAFFPEMFGHENQRDHNHLKSIRLLLKHDSINQSDWEPALYHIVQQGYRGYLNLFLEHGINVNESYFGRWTASIANEPRATSWKLLPVAAFYGHTGIVRLLLHRGADINDVTQGNCALAYAAVGKQGPMMPLLVKRGANIELAIRTTSNWANTRKITRDLRRLQASVTSPSNQFPEWQENEPLPFLNESYPQSPGDEITQTLQREPLAVTGDCGKIAAQSLLRSAPSSSLSKRSSTVYRFAPACLASEQVSHRKDSRTVLADLTPSVEVSTSHVYAMHIH